MRFVIFLNLIIIFFILVFAYVLYLIISRNKLNKRKKELEQQKANDELDYL